MTSNENDEEQRNRAGRVVPPPPAHRYVLIDSSYRPHRSHSGLPPNDCDDHNHNHDNLAVIVIVVSGQSLLGHIQARSIYLASTSIDVAVFVREVNEGGATHRHCCPSDLCRPARSTPEDISANKVSETGSEPPLPHVCSVPRLLTCVSAMQGIFGLEPAGFLHG